MSEQAQTPAPVANGAGVNGPRLRGGVWTAHATTEGVVIRVENWSRTRTVLALNLTVAELEALLTGASAGAAPGAPPKKPQRRAGSVFPPSPEETERKRRQWFAQVQQRGTPERDALLLTPPRRMAWGERSATVGVTVYLAVAALLGANGRITTPALVRAVWEKSKVPDATLWSLCHRVSMKLIELGSPLRCGVDAGDVVLV